MHVHPVARRQHLALARRTLEVGDARERFAVQDDPRCIFSDRNDARREGLTHAPNDALTVKWARTMRIDAPADEARSRLDASPAPEGVRSTPGPASEFARTYVLVEGPESVDPAQVAAQMEGRWFGEAIIAVAIEPRPADALPQLHETLAGAGAPAGVISADVAGASLLVEIAPSQTSPLLVLQLVDVELRRFQGVRTTQLLSPLPVELTALVAAQGLGAPEIAPDRILESLLGAGYVE